jgi:uncharacterized protein (TIGR00369 family)
VTSSPSPSAPSGRPFYDFLGLEVDPRDDKAVVRLPYRPDLGNSREHMHGGAIATLLDAAASRAARQANPRAAGVATIDATIHYLRPGTTTLTAEGQVISSGGTIAVAQSQARDADGDLVASATVTFRIFKSRQAAPSLLEEAHARG